MLFMKTLLLVLAAAGLSGCAVYPASSYGTYGAYESYGPYQSYGMSAPYVVTPHVYIQGGAVYQSNTYPSHYRHVVPPHAVQPPVHAPRPRVRDRDRDRNRDSDGDGVPNRLDRDRDGDGLPNRLDHRPNDPHRR